jgi:hypothetical protein
MKKEELARAIFEQHNRINELNGKQVIAIDSPLAKHKIWESCKLGKAQLEHELEELKRSYDALVAKNKHQAKVAAYYATPEGAVIKAETEKAMDRKAKEWDKLDKATRERLDKSIHSILGKNWGIARYKKGYVEIGVIDAGKSTQERREFFFGQTIDIRYEERHWLDKREILECNCGSCGGFSMEGGTTVGERAMFYIGIGRLFGDALFVAELKAILKEASQKTDRISGEYNDLHNKLANPFAESEKQL